MRVAMWLFIDQGRAPDEHIYRAIEPGRPGGRSNLARRREFAAHDVEFKPHSTSAARGKTSNCPKSCKHPKTCATVVGFADHNAALVGNGS